MKFRPHHFLCTLCFQGKGYSTDFVRNYKHIVKNLTNETAIEVTLHTDSICAPCPHKRDLQCTAQEKINQLDASHAQALQLPVPNDINTKSAVITWKAAKNLIQKNMTLEKFHKICQPCEWKKYGLCEKTLTEFLAKKEENS